MTTEAAKKILEEQASATIGTSWKPPKEIKTNSDLNDVMLSYSTSNAVFFARGFNSITVTTKINRNGSTDMNGNIDLTIDRIELVKAAFNSIRENKLTTLSQEDALSTLWHEITHNRNLVGHVKITTIQRQTMELANEFIARNTLPEFMQSIGGSLENNELINNRTSTGYNTMVRNYDALISWASADKAKVIEVVSKCLFEEPYDKQLQGLILGITNNSKYDVKDIAILVQKARDYNNEDAFKSYLDANKHLLIEKTR